MAAGHGVFSVDVRRVPGFPHSRFIFLVCPSFDFKGNGNLVDCVSPVHAIG